MAKPAVLAQLEKNKLIDVQENFVDTFNWIKDWINNIEVRDPLELDLTNDTKPILKSNTKIQCIDKQGNITETKSPIKTLTFKSGEDSNLSFKVGQDLSGNTTIFVDVYYKQN